LGLIEWLGGGRLGQRFGRPSDNGEVPKSDGACGHGLDGLRKPFEVLPDVDAIGRDAARRFAVVPDPVDRRGRAPVRPEITPGQKCCVLGKFDFSLIDQVTKLDEVEGNLLPRSAILLTSAKYLAGVNELLKLGRYLSAVDRLHQGTSGSDKIPTAFANEEGPVGHRAA
jgi:hypothetical protein